MFSLETIKELTDYNYWARDRQLEACAGLEPELLARPIVSSFPSVRDTLVHLLFAEWVWLERWRGRSPRRGLAADDLPTLEAIELRWRAVEREMRDYLSSVSEETLRRPMTYVNLKGETWTYPLGQTLYQLSHHQSYHRGQVTTMLRQLRVSPPPVDFLVYVDCRK